MASKNIKGLTVEIGGDTTELGKALESVESRSKMVSSELGAINKLLKVDPNNVEALTRKQKLLADAVENTSEKLKTLKEAEKQVQAQFEKDEVSAQQVSDLRNEIIYTTAKLKTYEKAAQETADAINQMGDGADDAAGELDETGDEAKTSAKKVDDFADSADKAEKSGSGLGSTLASAAKTGLAAIGTAATAAITGLVAAAESTREYRTEMAKLETAFTTAGYTSFDAMGSYVELQSVLGDTGQAVEAANHLAKLCDTEEQLNTWTNICTGVYGTFGASLPIEGLTEAANETAKTGQLTGALVDSLTWAGISEEQFQASLDACGTEQNRVALITETLNGLYSEAADTYRETNEAVIEANVVNRQWMEALSYIGEAIEPVITSVKGLGVDILSSLIPSVSALSDAVQALMDGTPGAANQIGEALSGIITNVLGLVTEFGPTLLEVAMSLIGTLTQTLIGQLPQLLTVGGQMVGQLISGIASGAPSVLQQAVDLIGNLVSALQQNLPTVLASGSEILLNLVQGISSNLPSLVNQALDILMNFAQTIYDNAPTLIETGFQALSSLVQGIVSCLPSLIEKVPLIVSTLANTINDNAGTILKMGMELIWQLVKGILSAIPTLISNIPQIITAIVDVWEAFQWLNLGKNAITALKNGIKNMKTQVAEAGKNILESVINAIKTLPSKLLSLGKNSTSNLGKALSNGVSSVISGAKAVFNAVVNTVKSLPSKMLSIGGDLIKGLWNGINNKLAWLKQKISSFTASVLDSIKGFFGVHSPSTETAWIGDMLDQGLAKGLLANVKDPVKAMHEVTSSVLGAMDGVDGLAIERGLQVSATTAAAQSVADSGILSRLDKIITAIEQGQIIQLDTDAIVGGTLNAIDNALGQRRILAARGAM